MNIATEVMPLNQCLPEGTPGHFKCGSVRFSEMPVRRSPAQKDERIILPKGLTPVSAG